MLHLQDFAYGPATPVLSYLAASVGILLGLRAATRARACQGASRTRWLLLAGVSVGGVGIWAMNVAGLLGLAVAGETTRYSVAVTIASLLGGSGGATAESFLLPLILGISVLSFILVATIALSLTDDEIRSETDLMARIGDLQTPGRLAILAR